MPEASFYSQKTITAMREWISDCLGGWTDLFNEHDITALSDQDVVDGVHRHFDGGVIGFLATDDPDLFEPRPGERIHRSTVYELIVDGKHAPVHNTTDLAVAAKQAQLLSDQGRRVRIFWREVVTIRRRRSSVFWSPTARRAAS